MLLAFSVAVPAQTQHDSSPSVAKSSQIANSGPVSVTALWNAAGEIADVPSAADQPNRINTDHCTVGPNTSAGNSDAAGDRIALGPYSQLGDGNVCYAILSYLVARDSKDSDSVHPVSSTTCAPAKRTQLRKVEIQPRQLDR